MAGKNSNIIPLITKLSNVKLKAVGKVLALTTIHKKKNASSILILSIELLGMYLKTGLFRVFSRAPFTRRDSN